MSFKCPLTKNFNLLHNLDSNSDRSLCERGKTQMETAQIILNKLEDRPGIILGDEVGMGKTWIALLTAISVVEKGGNVLVLTPSGVLSKQWEIQFRGLIGLKSLHPEKKEEYLSLIERYRNRDYTELIKHAKNKNTGPKIYVTSFGKVKKLDKRLCGLNPPPFDLLILDEGHNFKNQHTQRYKIFHDINGELNDRDPILYKQFRRILLLTATPFQLGHHELNGVLKVFFAAFFNSGLGEYKLLVSQLIQDLDRYQKLLAKFESRWRSLSKECVTQFTKAISARSGTMPPQVQDAYDCYQNLQNQKEKVNEGLLEVIVRNVKGNDHRSPKEHGIDLPVDKQLLFFLSERLDQINRRSPTPTKGHVHALPSSYGRFDDHMKIATSSPDQEVNYYAIICTELYTKQYRDFAHPKLDEIADLCFQNWLRGEKTLVFCGFLNTVTELETKLKAFIDKHLDQKRSELKIDVSSLEKLIEKFRNARNQDSLVFRDNAIVVSLIPLLEKNEISLGDFFKLTSADKSTLKEMLKELHYEPANPNYKKLQAALEHCYFSKFQDSGLYNIPEGLDDDFEFYTDKKAIKSEFDRIKDEDFYVGDKSKLVDAIDQYIDRLEQNDTLMKVATYPSMWVHYRDYLEPIDIEVRNNLTAMVSDYLTSDEFLVLHLFPCVDIQNLTPQGLVDIFISIKGTSDSMHEKTIRFLNYAVELFRQDNLKGLVEDMRYHFRRNKSSTSEAVVDTVIGDTNLDTKLKTVTAFKAPFAPYILISTSVLAEGVDLHTECRTVIHYDHEWNPATLEQKNGRVDRVGSKAEREKIKVLMHYPFLKNTQDQKAREVVKARASWFNIVMGQQISESVSAEEEDLNSEPLPDLVRENLRMRLDNDAHKMTSQYSIKKIS